MADNDLYVVLPSEKGNRVISVAPDDFFALEKHIGKALDEGGYDVSGGFQLHGAAKNDSGKRIAEMRLAAAGPDEEPQLYDAKEDVLGAPSALEGVGAFGKNVWRGVKNVATGTVAIPSQFQEAAEKHAGEIEKEGTIPVSPEAVGYRALGDVGVDVGVDMLKGWAHQLGAFARHPAEEATRNPVETAMAILPVVKYGGPPALRAGSAGVRGIGARVSRAMNPPDLSGFPVEPIHRGGPTELAAPIPPRPSDAVVRMQKFQVPAPVIGEGIPPPPAPPMPALPAAVEPPWKPQPLPERLGGPVVVPTSRIAQALDFASYMPVGMTGRAVLRRAAEGTREAVRAAAEAKAKPPAPDLSARGLTERFMRSPQLQGTNERIPVRAPTPEEAAAVERLATSHGLRAVDFERTGPAEKMLGTGERIPLKPPTPAEAAALERVARKHGLRSVDLPETPAEEGSLAELLYRLAAEDVLGGPEKKGAPAPVEAPPKKGRGGRRVKAAAPEPAPEPEPEPEQAPAPEPEPAPVEAPPKKGRGGRRAKAAAPEPEQVPAFPAFPASPEPAPAPEQVPASPALPPWWRYTSKAIRSSTPELPPSLEQAPAVPPPASRRSWVDYTTQALRAPRNWVGLAPAEGPDFPWTYQALRKAGMSLVDAEKERQRLHHTYSGEPYRPLAKRKFSANTMAERALENDVEGVPGRRYDLLEKYGLTRPEIDTLVERLKASPLIADEGPAALPAKEPAVLEALKPERVPRTLEEKQARADALPRGPKGRVSVLRAILDASGVEDLDTAAADAEYLRWSGRGRKGARPGAWAGGEIDSLLPDDGGPRPSGVFEAFDRLTRKARTWREVRDNVLPRLREVPGLERAQLPDEVMQRLIEQDVVREGEKPSSARALAEQRLREQARALDDEFARRLERDPWDE